MKIALTIPSFSPHGGTRIIIEWANRLAADHQVLLFCRRFTRGTAPWRGWARINPTVRVVDREAELMGCRLLIICSPHDIDLLKSRYAPKNKAVFMQMLEHMFQPGNTNWMAQCLKFYTAPIPLVAISQWNIEYLKKNFKRSAPVYYVGNGVNLRDFPIEVPCQRDGKTVLVEGWNALNPTKDVARFGPQVALQLKAEGYRILAYSQKTPHDFKCVPDEFHINPTLETLNDLYRRADVLIKASQYDARSCSPMEAMTKGCVPIRGIIQGDDDLRHLYNCWRTEYDAETIYEGAKTVLSDEALRKRLAIAGCEYVFEYGWGYWMPQIKRALGL